MTIVVIPAYKPSDELVALVDRFSSEKDLTVLVVDDGGGKEFKHIFDELRSRNCMVLTHEVNCGKGRALKTAMRYILDSVPDCDVVVTADADGQHSFDDISMVCEVARENRGSLVLGGRRFDENVPIKSRLGNSLTRRVFSLASGVKVYDTQTGLRAFSRELIEKFVSIDGERYEYEMNMLLTAAQSGVPIIERTIRTIYLDGNSSSHFNPFKDSLKIYFCIIKFAFSSFICFLIDYLFFMLFSAATVQMGAGASLIVSEVGARAISSVCNYFINRKMVFKSNEKLWWSFAKYIMLVVAILACDYALMYVATRLLPIPKAVAKPLVALILFFVNLAMQGRLVFRHRTKEKKDN